MAKETARPNSREIKAVDANYDQILKILAHPKQEAIYVNASPNDFESWDGAWDAQAAQKGLGMRRVSADVGRHMKVQDGVEIPSGFVFTCSCGYARRVVDSEMSFTCERGGPGQGCGLIWQKECYQDEDDINPSTGEPVWKAKLKEFTAPNGKKYLLPVMKGYQIADWRRLNREERRRQEEADPELAERRKQEYVQDRLTQMSEADFKKQAPKKAEDAE